MSAPLRYANGNILFGSNWQPAALFRMDTISNRYLGERENYDLASALAEFAYGIEAHFSIYRVSREWPVSQYRAQADAMIDAARADHDEWEHYLRNHEDRLAQLSAHVPEVYVVVQLTRPTSGFAANQRDQLIEAARKFIPTKRGILAKRELSELHAKADDIAAQYRSTLGLRAATTRELQWLLERTATRGVCEPLLDEFWQPAAIELNGGESFQPLDDTMFRLTDAAVTEKSRVLEVESDTTTSYQAMLTLGAAPEVTRFPGDAELLSRPLEQCPFPVDLVTHCRWLENPQAAAQVRDKVNIADTVIEEQAKAGRPAASSKAARSRAKASEFLDALESPAQPPLLIAATSLAVGAPDPETLDKRVAALKRAYGRVRLSRPSGRQVALYQDHYIRTDLGRVRGHQDRIWVLDQQGQSQFGAMMPIGTHHAGDDHGPYIGHTLGGAHRPVRFDITHASRSHRPPTIFLVGTSGSGKTITTQLLTYQGFLRGSNVTLIDPKGDNYLLDYPTVRDQSETILLSGDPQYKGMLDPLVIAPENMREDLTASYLMDLLPSAPAWTSVHVRQAIRRVLQDYKRPGCMHVVETLKRGETDDERQIGNALEVWSDSGIARLAFGDGIKHERARTRATRYDLRALSLPGAGSKAYDEAERLAVATLKLALTRAVTAAKTDLSRHDIIALDEAHVLLDTADGLKFVDKLTRTSRALNITLLLASQHVTDAGTLEDLVGYRFVFGQETERSGAQGIQLVGLNPADKGLVRQITRVRQGRCFFRDLSGRVVDMQIDLADPELLRWLDTDPNAERHQVQAVA